MMIIFIIICITIITAIISDCKFISDDKWRQYKYTSEKFGIQHTIRKGNQNEKV